MEGEAKRKLLQYLAMRCWRGLALIHLVGAAPLHDVAPATLLPANHSPTAANLTLLVSSNHAQLQPSHAVDTHLDEPSQGSPLHSLLAHAPSRDTPNRGARKVYIILIVASVLLTLFSIWHYNFAWPWPSTPHLQLKSARLPSVRVPSLQLTSLGDCIRAASMVAILIAAGAVFVQAPLQVRDGGPWNSPHHECTVTYHGVICVDPAHERVGDAVYLSQPLDWTIYAGAVAFALLTLLTILIHWWRKSMPMPQTPLHFSPSFADAYVPHAGPRLRTLLTDPWSLAKIIWLDWLHPAITGALIGLAMGAYQLVLQCLISAVWGNKGVTPGEPPYEHLSPWAVALLPPLLLGLTGWLQARLRAGAAGNFVQAVVNDLHIDLFRGLVVTTVVSLVAIVSGGSAGPEGPVLFMGAAIAIATRPLHQIFYEGSADKSGGIRERWHLWWDPRFKGRPMGDDALIGGCAAIAAFFDHPVSGCLLVMELPTRHGSMRRGEVLPSALVASTLSWATHRALMNAGDIPPPPLLPSVCPSIGHLLLAVPLGLVAGGLSLCFVYARRLLDSLPFHPAVRGVAFGGVVGLIALNLPDTLLWGEFQIERVANARVPLGVGDSTVFLVAKFMAIVITVASGYGAGIVYPLILVGYLTGPLAAQIFQPNAFALEACASSNARDAGVELVGQVLGSAMLASTMRVPLGAALLVLFIGGSSGDHGLSPTFFCILVIANLFAVWINPLSGLGQVYESAGQKQEPGREEKPPSSAASSVSREDKEEGVSVPKPEARGSALCCTGVEEPDEAAESAVKLDRAQRSRFEWLVYSVSFGLNYGSFKTAISYLPVLFSHETAKLGNTLNYSVWTVTTLLVAAAVVELWRSPKWTSVLAFTLWTGQNLLLVLASFLRDAPDDSGGPQLGRFGALQPSATTDPTAVAVIVALGCVLGGVAAALSWTAQGVYFALSGAKQAAEIGAEATQTLALRGAVFAGLELLSEAMCRVGVALMIEELVHRNLSQRTLGGLAFAVLALLSAVGAVATCFIEDLVMPKPKVADEQSFWLRGIRSGLSSIALLLTSSTAMLLQPFSLLKGLNEVFLAEYLNAGLTAPLLGLYDVGFLSAAGVMFGGAVGLASGVISNNFGRSTVMVAGILGWMIPSIIDAIRNAAHAEINLTLIIIYYLGYGCGRGVFDSANRALCTALFAPEHHPQIFALLRFGEGIAATIAFSAFPVTSGMPLEAFILTVGTISLLGYGLAEHINKPR